MIYLSSNTSGSAMRWNDMMGAILEISFYPVINHHRETLLL